VDNFKYLSFFLSFSSFYSSFYSSSSSTSFFNDIMALSRFYEFFFGKEQNIEHSMRIHDFDPGTKDTNTSNLPPSSNPPKVNNPNLKNFNSDSSNNRSIQNSDSTFNSTPSNAITATSRNERSSTIQVIPSAKNANMIQRKEEATGTTLKESEILRRKSMSYHQTIRAKEDEIKKRDEEINLIKGQISRLRPTPTWVVSEVIGVSPLNSNNSSQDLNISPPSSASAPASSVASQKPQLMVDSKNVNNEDLAVKIEKENMEACASEIEQLNRKLALQKEELDKLKRDLHGCRIRSRTYSSMVQQGSEIPEYTQFIESNRK